jgi:hypothetical protein
MRVSKQRLADYFRAMIDHSSMNPDQDFDDLHAVLIGNSRIRVKLETADTILQGHGIESVYDHETGRSFEYVNMGDTYAGTLICDVDGKLILSTFGDYVEACERKGIAFA